MNALTRKLLVAGALIAAASTASAEALDESVTSRMAAPSLNIPAEFPGATLPVAVPIPSDAADPNALSPIAPASLSDAVTDESIPSPMMAPALYDPSATEVLASPNIN
jgi:hypothetical protein